ncbi:MAG: hypothetical protein HKN43_02730 [Rhodothermales bacterium]|nr:hypothetical protein [Rhodothermales bacterium]
MVELIALIFDDEDSSSISSSIERLTLLVSEEVQALATSGDSGKHQQAVRLFRIQTGASLRDALYVVDRLKMFDNTGL